MKFNTDKLAEHVRFLSKDLNEEFLALMDEAKAMSDKFAETNFRDQFANSCAKVEKNYNEEFVPMLAKHIEVLEEQVPELAAKIKNYQAKEVKSIGVDHSVREVEPVPLSVL